MIYLILYLFFAFTHYAVMWSINLSHMDTRKKVVRGEYIFIAAIFFPLVYVSLMVILASKFFVEVMQKKYE